MRSIFGCKTLSNFSWSLASIANGQPDVGMKRLNDDDQLSHPGGRYARSKGLFEQY